MSEKIHRLIGMTQGSVVSGLTLAWAEECCELVLTPSFILSHTVSQSSGMLRSEAEFQQIVTQKSWVSVLEYPALLSPHWLAAMFSLVHLRLLENLLKQSVEYSCPPNTHTQWGHPVGLCPTLQERGF